MSIKHKNSKARSQLLNTMERDHDIRPGSIFKLGQKTWFSKFVAPLDEDKMVTSWSIYTPIFRKKGDIVMFVDIAYDPYMKKFLLRFLSAEQTIVLVYEKRKTLRMIKKNMSLVSLPTKGIVADD